MSIRFELLGFDEIADRVEPSLADRISHILRAEFDDPSCAGVLFFDSNVVCGDVKPVDTEVLDLARPTGVDYQNRFSDYDDYLSENAASAVVLLGDWKLSAVVADEFASTLPLFVQGSLRVRNLLIAAAEVYVAGDLEVAETLWVHGEGRLQVDGSLKRIQRPFVQNTFGAEILVGAGVALSPFNRTDGDPGELQLYVGKTAFEAKSMDRDFNILALSVQFSQAVQAVREGSSVDLRQCQTETGSRRSGTAVSAEIRSEVDLQADRPIFEKRVEELGSLRLDGAGNLTGWEVQVNKANPESLIPAQRTHSVSFSDKSGRIFVFSIGVERSFGNALRLLTGRGTSTVLGCVFVPDVTNLRQAPLNIFDSKVLPRVRGEAFALWRKFLSEAEFAITMRRWFHAAISPEGLTAILNNRLVQSKYNDYWDDEKQGFWDGRYYIAFRLNGANGFPGRVHIGYVHRGVVGSRLEESLPSFCFQLNQTESPTQVELLFTPGLVSPETDNFDTAFSNVPMLDWYSYYRALRFWFHIEERMRLAGADVDLEITGSKREAT